jgi:iron complex transport system substrate-binding protein
MEPFFAPVLFRQGRFDPREVADAPTQLSRGGSVHNTWIRRLGPLLAIGLILAATACGGGSSKAAATPVKDNPTPITGVSTPPAFPLTVKRSDGATLTISEPVKKIVSMSPGATEIIYAIGAQDALAAVDKNANYPDAAKNFPTKIDAYEPNIEAIAALNPDLVILPGDNGGILAKLDGLKIPVLYQDLDKDIKTVDDVLGQITLLGQVTGHTDKARELVQSLSKRIDVIKQGVQGIPSQDAPSVYHELDSTYYTISTGTFIGNLYEILHAQNIAKDGAGVAYPQLTQEAIIAANPKIIVLADEAYGVTADSVKARPGWSAIDAVANGKIIAVDADLISRPGPRIVDALEDLARKIYPTRFQ